MLFISIRSASQVQVPKVLKVVEETKRLRYKAGESCFACGQVLFLSPSLVELGYGGGYRRPTRF